MTADQATKMLDLLFERSPDKWINLRALPANRAEGRVVEEFLPTADLSLVAQLALSLRGSHDVYVGVAARDHQSGGGAAVSEVWTLWVDCDSPETTEALDGFALRPSLVVASGTPGNCHAYWILEDAVDPDFAEVLNHQLAVAIGGDPVCRDRARILRVPGTLNHKTAPATVVQIVSMSGQRYDAEAIMQALPQPAPSAPKLDEDSGKVASLCVRNVLSRLESVKAGKAGKWTSLCPAHDDRSPSLAISEGEDGRCLLFCHAGCSTKKTRPRSAPSADG